MERNYWTSRRLSRRGAIRGGMVGGLGLAGAALIGCGSDEEAPAGTPTPQQPGTTPAATPSPDPAAAQRGGTIIEARNGDPPNLHPYRSASFEVKWFGSASYSRLYRLDAGPGVDPNAALPIPDLASTAETDDGQTWVITLKEANFHDKAPVNGRPVTAEDVVFSFDMVTGEGSSQLELVRAAGWESLEAIDDRTLRFTLSDVNPAFLDDLADTNKLFVMPVEAEGGFNPELEAIGSGPWVFEEYNSSQHIRWTRNEDFYDDPPFADALEFLIIPEYTNRLAQFQAGNISRLTTNPNDVLPLRREQPDVHWNDVQTALLSFVFFSPADREPDAPWRDERFRQAISMGLPRDEITDFAYNVSELRDAGLDPKDTWNNLIPAGMVRWWLDPQSAAQGESARFFEYNPQEARALLDAGGWDGASFAYQYTGDRYGLLFNEVAEVTANFIAELGLDPQTEVQDYASVYITQTFAGEFNGIAFGYETPFPEVGGYFPRMFGEDPLNHSRIRDERITELSRLQGRELDEEQRREYIWDIQRINGEQMYYVPNQAGAGSAWIAYRPQVLGSYETRGYGFAREVAPFLWFAA